MREKDINLINTLQELSAYDFIMNCVGLRDNSKDAESIIYTANELRAIYPKLFSKYKLDQAIKNDNLPCFRSGHERYFVKSEIDKWISDKSRYMSDVENIE